jgi:hypothetical protein
MGRRVPGLANSARRLSFPILRLVELVRGAVDAVSTGAPGEVADFVLVPYRLRPRGSK